MLTVRYNKKTGLLTGWKEGVKARSDAENVVTMDIAKPNSDDYENYCYIGGKLVASGKPLPIARRDPIAEIDELKARLDSLGVRK